MARKKDVGEWTREDFERLPSRKSFDSKESTFDSLILIPQRRIHDSGYRCITVVAVKNFKPFIKVTECSDVIHFDGIGGYGKLRGSIPTLVPVSGWDMDFLKVSGLPRIWCNGNIEVGASLSSFSIYRVQKEQK